MSNSRVERYYWRHGFGRWAIIFGLLSAISIFVFFKPINQAELDWADQSDFMKDLPAANQASYVFKEEELEIELDYSAAVDGQLNVSKDRRGISLDSSQLIDFSRAGVRVLGLKSADRIELTINQEKFDCYTHKIRGEVNECFIENGPQQTETVARISDVLSIVGPLWVVYVVALLWFKAGKPSVMLTGNKETGLVLSKSALLPLLAVIVLAFWLPPYDKALFFVTNAAREALDFGQLWDFNGFIVASLIDYFRGLVSLVVGSAIESRLYFSGVLAAVYFAYAHLGVSVSKGWFSKERIGLKTAFMVGGLLAVLNPFTVQRVILGHHLLLLGFALFGVIISLLVSRKPALDVKFVLKITSLSTLAVAISPHFIPLIIFSLIIFVLSLLPGLGLHPELFKAKSVVSALRQNRVLTLVLASSTVILVAQLIVSTVSVANFSDSELLFWAPKSDIYYDIWINALSGQGYWLEGSIVSLKWLGPFWILPGLITLGASGFGVLLVGSKNRRHGSFLAISLLVATVFYLGVNTIWRSIGEIYQVLYEYWLLRGLRESQKFGAIIATIQIILSSFSIFWLFSTKKIGPIVKYSAIMLIASTLLFSVQGLVNYGQGSIARCTYPPELVELANSLKTDEKVLYVPANRHGYFNFCSQLSTINPGLRLLGNHGEVDQTDYLQRPQIDEGYLIKTATQVHADYILVLYGNVIPEESIEASGLNCTHIINTNEILVCGQN